MKLVNLAMKTYEHRIEERNDNKMFNTYKEHMSMKAFKRLNLGPVGNVPGRTHRSIAGGGRSRPRPRAHATA